MYSFSKFCIPHWLSSLQQHRRKVLKETQKNHIKTFIFGKLPWNITTIVPFSFGDPAIARSENKFSLVANTSWRSEQNGVRIPRQILVSHDLNRPITYRWWWQPLSQPRFGTQALSRVTQRLRKLWMEFAKYVVFWLRSYGLECITHYSAAMVVVWWISIIIFKRPLHDYFSDTGNKVQSG